MSISQRTNVLILADMQRLIKQAKKQIEIQSAFNFYRGNKLKGERILGVFINACFRVTNDFLMYI